MTTVLQAAGHDTFWADLDADTANAMLKRARQCSYARGRVLAHENQLPDRVTLLRAGCVKVSRPVENGPEVVLAFRGPGELIGELSAIEKRPYSATLTVIEPVDALVMSHSDFYAFLLDHPVAGIALARSIARRLREADTRIKVSSQRTIGRVAIRLLELADRFGEQDDDGRIRISLRITHDELAGWTSSSVESVGRALATMRRAAYIETGRRDIQVLDRAGLAALLI